ncbi:amino acid permease [Jatrophihabitans fulvus]
MLYVGALLGPGVLIVPGVAAGVAGPAAVLAWLALLTLSALLAWMFSALGTRLPDRGGAAGYVAHAFGPRAGRATAGCFVAGTACGAPVVCLIGGGYAAAAVGGGRSATVGAAALMLVVVVGLTLGGARVSAAAQLLLVATLTAVVVIAVVGSAPHARAAYWQPFAPHGWTAVGRAAALLMLSFVGWEAIAPLVGRLRDRERRLPRVIAISFGVTSTIYLGLAVTTVGVLGPRAGTHTPVADLLAVAVGRGATAIAAVAAVALTLAAVNAYLAGAVATVAAAVPGRPTAGRLLPATVGGVGLVVLGGVAAGWWSAEQLIVLPTACFVAVYLGCTASGVRALRGAVRVGSLVACVAVGVVAGFTGWSMVVPACVALLAITVRIPSSERADGTKSVVEPTRVTRLA